MAKSLSQFKTQEQALKLPVGRHWHSMYAGFGVNVSKGGTRSYIYSYRNARGVKRQATIGRCNMMSMADAINRAKDIDAEARIGGDPVADKRDKRNETVVTFGDVCGHYLDYREAAALAGNGAMKTFEQDKKRFDTVIVPTFGHLEIMDFNRAFVKQWHAKKKASHPAMADAIIHLMRAAWNWAQFDASFLPDNLASPFQRWGFRGKRRRKVVLHEDEYTRLVEVIRRHQRMGSNRLRGKRSPRRKAAFLIEFIGLTGCRRSEGMAADWNKCNRSVGIITIKDKRNRFTGEIWKDEPITPALAELLNRIDGDISSSAPKHDQDGNLRPNWIFPSPGSKSGHVENIDKRWADFKKEAGITRDIHIHDIRRTLMNWMDADGTGAATISKAVGHDDIQSTLGYLNGDLAAAARAKQKTAARIAGLAG